MKYYITQFQVCIYVTNCGIIVCVLLLHSMFPWLAITHYMAILFIIFALHLLHTCFTLACLLFNAVCVQVRRPVRSWWSIVFIFVNASRCAHCCTVMVYECPTTQLLVFLYTHLNICLRCVTLRCYVAVGVCMVAEMSFNNSHAFNNNIIEMIIWLDCISICTLHVYLRQHIFLM